MPLSGPAVKEFWDVQLQSVEGFGEGRGLARTEARVKKAIRGVARRRRKMRAGGPSPGAAGRESYTSRRLSWLSTSTSIGGPFGRSTTVVSPVPAGARRRAGTLVESPWELLRPAERSRLMPKIKEDPRVHPSLPRTPSSHTREVANGEEKF